jgi:hypothetical protein
MSAMRTLYLISELHETPMAFEGFRSVSAMRARLVEGLSASDADGQPLDRTARRSPGFARV